MAWSSHPRSGSSAIPTSNPKPTSPYPFAAPSEPADDVAEVREWARLFVRAVKGGRLYPPGNPVLEGYVERAHAALEAVTRTRGPLVITVAEDRWLFRGEAVHVDPDRVEGLPFALFRSAIQSFELSPAITAADLGRVVTELGRDPEREGLLGEDLVTLLWRAAIPGFSYAVIDLFNMQLVDPSAAEESDVLVDEELRRLRAEVARVSGALDEAAPAEDGRVSLDPLLAAGGAVPRHGGALEPARGLAALDGEPELAERLYWRLVPRLEQNPRFATTPAWRLVLALLDKLLEAGRLGALGTIARRPSSGEGLLAVEVRRHLGSPARVRALLARLETTTEPRETREALELLGDLEAYAHEPLVEALLELEQPTTRRRVLEMVAPGASAKPEPLRAILPRASAELLCELLGHLESLPPAVAVPLVRRGLEHTDPATRARSVGALRLFGGPAADSAVAAAVRDPDLAVRQAALRVGGQRPAQVVLDAILATIKGPEIDRMDPTEQRALLGAGVALVGPRMVPLLAHLLHDAREGGVRKRHPDLRIIAAQVLSQLDAPEARAALERGRRAIQRKVKQACVTGLAESPRAWSPPKPPAPKWTLEIPGGLAGGGPPRDRAPRPAPPATGPGSGARVPPEDAPSSTRGAARRARRGPAPVPEPLAAAPRGAPASPSSPPEGSPPRGGRPTAPERPQRPRTLATPAPRPRLSDEARAPEPAARPRSPPPPRGQDAPTPSGPPAQVSRASEISADARTPAPATGAAGARPRASSPRAPTEAAGAGPRASSPRVPTGATRGSPPPAAPDRAPVTRPRPSPAPRAPSIEILPPEPEPPLLEPDALVPLSPPGRPPPPRPADLTEGLELDIEAPTPGGGKDDR